MIFWSDATDRESPVPSEAINISHLPTRSGRGSRGALGRRAPCHQARVCKSQVATVLLLGFRDGQGGLAPKTTLSGVNGGWGGGGWRILGQNKESARTKSLYLDRTVIASTLQQLSGSGPTSGSHTRLPTERVAWKEGQAAPHAGMHLCPPGPQVHTWPAWTLFPMPTLPTKQASSHPLWCSLGSPGRDTHTHIHAFM